MQAGRRRLMQDARLMRELKDEAISAAPDPNDIMSWTGTIQGARGSEWEGGIFRVSLKFTESYPIQPPTVTFLQPIPFHPNINPTSGSVCVTTLNQGGEWGSWNDICTVLVSLQCFLTAPNPNSRLNPGAGDLYNANRAAYMARVRQCVAESRK
jgi:ubiquitin-protein ligase